MNPPFSRRATGGALDPDADLKHVRSAYRLLRPGGRLVAVTSAHCIPDGERWRRACQAESLQPIIRFTAEVGGQVYAARGTRFASRLTVVDKPTGRGEQPDSAVDTHARADTAADLFSRLFHWLLEWRFEAVMSFLTGLMAGGLLRLWPWRHEGALLTPAEWGRATGGGEGDVGLIVAMMGLGAGSLWLLTRMRSATG